ncbi:Pro-Pol polyprotein, partial [Araneus ventricosus]
MTFLAKGKKCDLIALATEMGEEPSPDMNIMGLKALITGSQSYEEEFVKGMLDTKISSRKEEAEKEENQEDFIFEIISCFTKKRVPITPVARPELPFQVVNIDIIGPIDPPSAKGHRYVLCLVDQHTRWAEALPLTSLTAKATCEALLTIFMRTGVPNVIASDNGTNFNASLTQEFEKRMGSSPRFSTPLHPESNGLVERFNQTLKKMLPHVILEEPRSWHTKIPFVLWAYREAPNSTT